MKVLDQIAECVPDAMLADGLDDAVLGHDTKGRVVYSVERAVGIFMERDGMDLETAREHFDFNVEQAYVGEMTPLYIYTYDA